jgi:hypothetical protein
MDKDTGKDELGQFLISKRPPALPDDIKDYEQGITDDMRLALVKWAKLPNKLFTKYKNWEALNLIFDLNGH